MREKKAPRERKWGERTRENREMEGDEGGVKGMS